MNLDIKASDIRRWLSQDNEDAGETAIQELSGLIWGQPLDETVNSIRAFLDNEND